MCEVNIHVEVDKWCNTKFKLRLFIEVSGFLCGWKMSHIKRRW